jgi:hypothetical protein
MIDFDTEIAPPSTKYRGFRVRSIAVESRPVQTTAIDLSRTSLML